MKTKVIKKVIKKFDCVQYARKERERIAQETEGKSPEYIVQYFINNRNNKNKQTTTSKG